MGHGRRVKCHKYIKTFLKNKIIKIINIPRNNSHLICTTWLSIKTNPIPSVKNTNPLNSLPILSLNRCQAL